jgi:hypothetical protein
MESGFATDQAEILWLHSVDENSENLGPRLPWTGQMTGNVATGFSDVGSLRACYQTCYHFLGKAS